MALTANLTRQRPRAGDRMLAVLVALAIVASMAPLAGAVASRLGGALASVIVQKDAGAGSRPEALVEAMGGLVSRQIGIINGFSALVPVAALARLVDSPGIRAVTPNSAVRMSSVDPDLGYDAVSDSGSMFSITRTIKAHSAWDAGVTGRGIDVAVIDTGVSPRDELAGRVINGPDLSFESQADNLRYLDSYGHGTHMAGIIAGRDPAAATPADYTKDHFVGVAPEARIVSVKVGAYDGATDVSQVIAAIDWVVQHRRSGDLNIRVLNLSFGTNGIQDYVLDPLAYAAEVAWHKGIVVVVAAGNEGFGNQRLNNPAYDPYVIAVGADDIRGNSGTGNDIVPDFSSRGDSVRRVDFIAPGKSVVSLRSPGSYVDENHPTGRVGDRYFRGSGTSQAAAVTSGAAALLLQARPELSPDQVKCLFTATATKVNNADPIGRGAGLINVDDARKAAIPADCEQTWPRATGRGSLDAARGSIDIYEDGMALDGEQDIFGLPFDTAEWAGRSWTGTSWEGGDWMGRSWTGDGWCDAGWTGRSWTGRSWTGRSWTGRSWTGRSWTGRSWTGRSWTGEAWAGRSWTSDTWAGHIWSGSGWE